MKNKKLVALALSAVLAAALMIPALAAEVTASKVVQDLTDVKTEVKTESGKESTVQVTVPTTSKPVEEQTEEEVKSTAAAQQVYEDMKSNIQAQLDAAKQAQPEGEEAAPVQVDYAAVFAPTVTVAETATAEEKAAAEQKNAEAAAKQEQINQVIAENIKLEEGETVAVSSVTPLVVTQKEDVEPTEAVQVAIASESMTYEEGETVIVMIGIVDDAGNVSWEPVPAPVQNGAVQLTMSPELLKKMKGKTTVMSVMSKAKPAVAAL